MFWSISTGFTARGFGKPIGPVFLALLPGIFIIKNIPKSIIYGFITFIILYILWFYFGVKRPRHFLSEIALLSIISAYLLVYSKNEFKYFFNIFSISFSILFLFQIIFYFKLHFLNIEKIQYITGSINREKFLENNMNKMSRAYPNFGVLDYINNLEDSTTIVSMYVGNDYYINPKINFIDSVTSFKVLKINFIDFY